MDYSFIENKTEYEEDVNHLVIPRFVNHDIGSERKRAALDVQIAEIEEFTVRMKNTLLFMRIYTVAQLIKLSRVQLITAPGIGVKGRLLIQKYLEEKQLVDGEKSKPNKKVSTRSVNDVN